ncbi:MAG: sensor histidine kinase [Algoriphagus sp.]|nr:sensor histidine kinase [Algoriphagus sp.]
MLIFLHLALTSYSQDLKSLLRKAATTADSADYYFGESKKLIIQPEDQAEFDFAKNAYHANSGELDSCIYFGQRAFEYFKGKNDLLKQVYILHYMGVAYRMAGQYEEAINRLFQAIPISQQLGDLTWQGWILQGISLNYHDFGAYQKGISFGQRALEVLSKNLEKDPRSVAIALNTLAINYDDWGKYDSALFFHMQVMDLKDRLDTLQFSFTYNNIGNTLIKLNRLPEAKNWIQRAIVITEKRQSQGNDESYDLATNYTNLGQILGKQGIHADAKAALRKGLAFAQLSQSLEKIKDSYQALYEFNKSSGKSDSALVYLELLSGVEDSIFNLQSAKAISDAEAKYELAEKERNLTEERLRVQQSRFALMTLAAILGLVGVLGFHFFRQQKLKSIQKDQEIELQKALSKVETQTQLHEQRLKISRDLHDNIGTQLTFVTLGMDSLKASFSNPPGPVLNQIDHLKTFTKTTIQELRDTVWAMNQSQMTFEDIQGRILGFTENLTWKEDLSLEIELDPELEKITLGSFEGISIYRIIQESLNNALKHAQASVISARLNKDAEGLQIIIQDNGIGFDPSSTSGNGLTHLRSRVNELNGSISFHSVSGEGTQIEISIPLQSS